MTTAQLDRTSTSARPPLAVRAAAALLVPLVLVALLTGRSARAHAGAGR